MVNSTSSDQIASLNIMTRNDFSQYLCSTPFLDFHHPAIKALVSTLTSETTEAKVQELYYIIRDTIRYNPYTVTDGTDALKASFGLENQQAYCIPKSALMVAASRALGVPARLGLADVRNHLASQKLLDWLGTDLFVMHGYADLWLNGKWVKCTPVFNRDLCEKFNVAPLEFDGIEDAIFHSHTLDGSKHMEYVHDHGTFADVPSDFILHTVAATYPRLNLGEFNSASHSLEQDLAQQR